MAQKNAADVAAKWAANLAASTDSIRRGVQAVSESPGAAAARSADLWQQRVSDPNTKEKFRRNSARVTLESWKSDMLDKGINRIGTGAQKAKQKFSDFMTSFLPHVESVAAQVRAMPKGGIEDSVARAAAMIRGLAQYRRS